MFETPTKYCWTVVCFLLNLPPVRHMQWTNGMERRCSETNRQWRSCNGARSLLSDWCTHDECHRACVMQPSVIWAHDANVLRVYAVVAIALEPLRMLQVRMTRTRTVQLWINVSQRVSSCFSLLSWKALIITCICFECWRMFSAWCSL